MLRQKRRHREDPSAQAGWMFADLLLAIAVIFLATISFVPTEAALSPNLIAAAAADPTVNVNKNSIPLTQFDQITIMLAMQKYAQDNNLPPEYTVSSVSIVGGYNLDSETADRGTQTALRYATGIAELNLPYFKNTSTILSASSTIPSGQVVLNLTITSAK
ncbi:unannotated protein [freshwater metagenome]|uniref:Unannotated protein n=1 Tax=freshwater metagenome TaxID=449393 RepID=A0A6J7ETI4_9ZZZZ|nr:hypothetical protein [Actinomycetota bacterium]